MTGFRASPTTPQTFVTGGQPLVQLGVALRPRVVDAAHKVMGGDVGGGVQAHRGDEPLGLGDGGVLVAGGPLRLVGHVERPRALGVLRGHPG